MCDTIVAVGSATKTGALLFGKNSDREPGEAHVVEFHPRREYRKGARQQCTWISVDQVRKSWQTVLCRPFWIWGAEMGVNEHGLTIGNQAVFTRFTPAKSGLTGMDLVRLALERATGAEEALEVILELIARYGQGGRCGWRHKNFRYDSAFVIADPKEAWILETAGPFWAAKRVESVWALSNGLSLGSDFDRLSDGAAEYGREQGWVRAGADFDFAAAFQKPAMDLLAGATARRQCTLKKFARRHGALTVSDFVEALSSHGEGTPQQGLRLSAPCAHASWLPTRSSGQTVGALIGELSSEEPRYWATGTSSPCLSVFKPLVLGAKPMSTGPKPGPKFDESLFWRHEVLHRRVMLGATLGSVAREERQKLQQESFAVSDAAGATKLWEKHREAVLRWSEELDGSSRSGGPFAWYWKAQSFLDEVPV